MLRLTQEMRLQQVQAPKGLHQKISKSHGIRKTISERHRYDMALFVHWLVFRDAATLLGLLESAEYFDPQSYNQVFEGELEKLLARIHAPGLRHQVEALRDFDWAAYIERSLRRAGFRDDDVQEHFHAIVVKLVVSPGRLFTGWEPGKHGPLERRFRASVWNAIRNIAEKARHHRKWVVVTDPLAMAERLPGRQPYSDLIDRFRQVVAEKLGRVALMILDARLAGEDTKDFVGRADIGTPSAFYIKKEVQAIKHLAQQFAARLGDSDFANMVGRAMEREEATVEKRRRSTAARRA